MGRQIDQDTLNRLHRKFRDEVDGKICRYLPGLRKARPSSFGLAAMTKDGYLYEKGDSEYPFTIQSIAKVVLLLKAYKRFGVEKVYEVVGTEPLNGKFNSITLDDKNMPHNPMINSGAIAIAGMLRNELGAEWKYELSGFVFDLLGCHVNIDTDIFNQEINTGHMNYATAHLLKSQDLLQSSVDRSIELYTYACSVIVNAKNLAMMAGTLANSGRNPQTGKQVLDPFYVQHCLSIMLTCGLYQYAGRWLVDIGVPAKSGISGGLIASVNKLFGLGVYSPLIDEYGTSVRGVRACFALDDELQIHIVDNLT